MKDTVKLPQKLNLGETLDSIKLDNEDPFQKARIIQDPFSDAIPQKYNSKASTQITFYDEDFSLDREISGDAAASGTISNIVELSAETSASDKKSTKKHKTTCVATYKKITDSYSLNYKNIESKINSDFLQAVDSGNESVVYFEFGNMIVDRVDLGQQCIVVFDIESDKEEDIKDFKSKFSADYQKTLAELKVDAKANQDKKRSIQFYNYREDKKGDSAEMQEFINLFKKYQFAQQQNPANNNHQPVPVVAIQPAAEVIEHVPLKLSTFAANAGLSSEQKKTLKKLSISVDKANLLFKEIAALKEKIQKEYDVTTITSRKEKLKGLFNELNELEQNEVFLNVMQASDSAFIKKRCETLDKVKTQLANVYQAKFTKHNLAIGKIIPINFTSLPISKAADQLCVTVTRNGQPISDLEMTLKTKYKHVLIREMAHAKKENAGEYHFNIKDYYKENNHQFFFQINKGEIPDDAVITITAKNSVLDAKEDPSVTVLKQCDILSTTLNQLTTFAQSTSANTNSNKGLSTNQTMEFLPK